jgi:hypothetical protein
MARRYIDFTTREYPDEALRTFANSLPVYKPQPVGFSKWLGSVAGVRVDGVSVEDINQETASKIEEAIAVGTQAVARGKVVDCVTFSALMDGQDLNACYGFNADSEAATDTSVQQISYPSQVIERRIGDGRYKAVHVVTPLVDKANTYDALAIHKLGYAGPVCLSTVGQAVYMYAGANQRAAMISNVAVYAPYDRFEASSFLASVCASSSQMW